LRARKYIWRRRSCARSSSFSSREDHPQQHTPTRTVFFPPRLMRHVFVSLNKLFQEDFRRRIFAVTSQFGWSRRYRYSVYSFKNSLSIVSGHYPYHSRSRFSLSSWSFISKGCGSPRGANAVSRSLKCGGGDASFC